MSASPDHSRCCQAHRQSPSPRHLRKHTRSQGPLLSRHYRLRRSYDPVRLPPGPPPVATLRPLPSPMTGLPRLPEPPFRRAVPTTPADRTGARVDCLRTASAAHGGKLTVVAAPYRDHMLLTFGKPETALLARR